MENTFRSSDLQANAAKRYVQAHWTQAARRTGCENFYHSFYTILSCDTNSYRSLNRDIVLRWHDPAETWEGVTFLTEISKRCILKFQERLLSYPSRAQYRCSKALLRRFKKKKKKKRRRRLVCPVFCVFNYFSMDSNSICKWRRTPSATGRFWNMTSEHLKAEATQLNIASSKLSFNNNSRAKEVLKTFSAKIGNKNAEKPLNVCLQWSWIFYQNTVVRKPENLCLMTKLELTLIQGIWVFHAKKAHKSPWIIEKTIRRAAGSPLSINESLKKFRSNHQIHIFLMGQSKIWTIACSLQHVCQYEKRCWYSHEDEMVAYIGSDFYTQFC